jgi:polyribonucleotide nucleotidyltransferase
MGVLPSPEEFPYTIRIVSDITESNGSSSMASVCGGCLALMDAGVPIKATCAGISVGRFADDNDRREIFVTDIIGEEDFFGDMDFKVSGTRDGITGIQLDLKTRGLVLAQIEKILEQARVGRLQIIDTMERTIPAPRPEIFPPGPAPGHHQDRPREDRQAHRPRRQDDPRPPGQVRRHHRRRGRRHVMIAATNGPHLESRQGRDRGPLRGDQGRDGLHRQGRVHQGLRRLRRDRPGTDGMCHISELAEGYVKSVHDVVRSATP